MESKVAAVAPTPDPSMANIVPSTPPPKKVVEAAAIGEGSDQGEMRLVIEQDQASGSYVYKTINRLTGEVIQQLPRAEVLRLREGAQYAAGSVIRTEA